ncbi:glycine dehydrogenase subunit 2 [mine drainage metagenome]|uniref:Glycine dehydrogenase subunit 2 n=1 Tax=mine drainage metagenome TaxID=410659 RepID=T1BQE7_9ZZZZ
MSFKQARYDEPFIKDLQSRTTFETISEEYDDSIVPATMRSAAPNMPEIAEYDVVRHFTRLSQMNYSVDTGFYPLGSCTMKFNPKYADKIASIPLFSEIHPLRPEWSVQGTLQVMFELQEYLKEISDMDEVTLQPLAGAQGELTGVLVIRKYFELRGELSKRREIVVPDSAHGTNPASAAMGGFDVVEIPSNDEGIVDLDALRYAITDRTAAFMITNPNTLGIFDHNVVEIAKIVHSRGALLYYDGANLNAILGITSPGLMGFDVVHFNLHKTFATPHGGGGPGAAPVAVNKDLADLVPGPIVRKGESGYILDSRNNKLRKHGLVLWLIRRIAARMVLHKEERVRWLEDELLQGSA